MLTPTPHFLKTLERPWRLYNDFRGRSGRLEFWSFSVLVYGSVATIVMFLILVGQLVGIAPAKGSIFYSVALIVSAVIIFSTIMPSLSVTVRRLHDSGMSGWFILLIFVPVIGALILMVLLALPGEAEGNRYGPPPARDTAFA